MMYAFLGSALGLAAFLGVNACLSLGASLLWRAGFGSRWRTPARRARLLFALRVAPAVLSILFTVGVFTPSYLMFEPGEADESVTAPLALLAGLGAVLLVTALYRGVASWRATRRLAAEWMSSAREIRVTGVDLPAYCIESPLPIVSVAGVLRPRLFVARQVVEGLTPDEMAVVGAHEAGHVAAADNLKRLIVRSCPDWLSLGRAGRGMEQDWARAGELAADDHAAGGDTARALDLAAALLKVARLVPSGSHSALPVSALHSGDDLDQRVRRLAEDGRSEGRPEGVGRTWPFVALPIALALLAALPWALRSLHGLTETVVRLLS